MHQDFKNHTIVLETEHFYLRPFDDQDIPLLYNLGNDPGVIKSWKCKPWSKEDAQRHFSRFRTLVQNTNLTKYPILTKENNDFIGYCGFSNFDDPDNDRFPNLLHKEEIIELGYALHEKYWGKGYATEVTKACVNFAFSQQHSFKHIVAVTTLTNTTSQRVLQKIGFQYLQEINSKKFGREKLFINK